MFNARTTVQGCRNGYLVSLRCGSAAMSTGSGLGTYLEAMIDFDAGVRDQEEVRYAIEDVLEALRRIVVGFAHFDSSLDQILWYFLWVSSDEDYLFWRQYLGDVLVHAGSQPAGRWKDGDLLCALRRHCYQHGRVSI